MTEGNPCFVKYVEIEEITSPKSLVEGLAGKEVDVYEKIDGGNCQVRNVRGGLFAGSKANFLKGMAVRNSGWRSKFVNWMHSNSGFYNLPEDLILFGEWAGNHTIGYDEENSNTFFLLDALDLSQNRFLPYEVSASIVNDLGIRGVKYSFPIHKGEIREKDIVSLLNESSALYSGKKEGLVIKDYNLDSQLFYKILNPEFTEKREKTFGRKDFFTDARIRKAFLRLKDEGDKISFDVLVQGVIDDVKKEVGKNFSSDYVSKRVSAYIAGANNGCELLKR